MCHLSYVCFTACKLKSSLVKSMQWNNTLHDLVLVLVICEFECVLFATRALLKLRQNAFVWVGAFECVYVDMVLLHCFSRASAHKNNKNK